MQPISKIEWAVYVFIAHTLTKVADPNLDGGEKIELMSVSFDEFVNVALQPEFVEQEIYRDVTQAQTDPNKMIKLKELFYN